MQRHHILIPLASLAVCSGYLAWNTLANTSAASNGTDKPRHDTRAVAAKPTTVAANQVNTTAQTSTSTLDAKSKQKLREARQKFRAKFDITENDNDTKLNFYLDFDQKGATEGIQAIKRTYRQGRDAKLATFDAIETPTPADIQTLKADIKGLLRTELVDLEKHNYVKNQYTRVRKNEKGETLPSEYRRFMSLRLDLFEKIFDITHPAKISIAVDGDADTANGTSIGNLNGDSSAEMQDSDLGASVSTKQDLGKGYTTDGTKVYWQGVEVAGANPKTFSTNTLIKYSLPPDDSGKDTTGTYDLSRNGIDAIDTSRPSVAYSKGKQVTMPTFGVAGPNVTQTSGDSNAPSGGKPVKIGDAIPAIPAIDPFGTDTYAYGSEQMWSSAKMECAKAFGGAGQLPNEDQAKKIISQDNKLSQADTLKVWVKGGKILMKSKGHFGVNTTPDRKATANMLCIKPTK